MAADPELSARIEGWPRAAIRLLTAADGLVRVHLLVDGTARVERFGRDGRWLESEFAFWADDGRKHTDSSLAEVLEAFGVAQPDAIATAAEMRSAVEPLVGPKGSRWSDLLFYFGWWGVLASGWIAAIVLAIVVLVVLL